MTAEAPLVVLVRRAGASDGSALRREAERFGWDVILREAVPLTAGSGRRLLVLGRCDAADLYVDLHRRPTAVLATDHVHVRTHPASPLRDDRVVSVRDFCCYKSYYSLLQAKADRSWSDEFAEWLAHISCDGHTDCRCLPFHVFAAKSKYDLTRQEERARFQRDHRQLQVLRDDRRRDWSPARRGARHGREATTVAGFRLENGFHWDVSPRQSPTIATADTVWTVKSYLNVYPDGVARIGNRCYQDWTRAQSDKADALDRHRH